MQPSLKECRVLLHLLEESICVNYFEFFCMGNLYILHHLFIYPMFFKLTWRDEKTKSRVKIHQTETPGYSSPVKLLFQVVQKRFELSFPCVLGIGGKGGGREEGGGGEGRRRERRGEKKRERDQGMRKIPALNKNTLANTTKKWSEFLKVNIT